MTNITHDERNYLLDNLKGILIFLVVFGHTLELYKNDYFIVEVIYMFIYLFHMPVFIFISGYFSKNVNRCRDTAFKKFFIPFLIFNTCWNLIAYIIMPNYTFSFITPGWALWYLLSMFFWRFFLKDLIQVRYIFAISILIGLCAGFFDEFGGVLSLSRTLVFFPFFLIGYRTPKSMLFKLKRPSRFVSFGIFIFTLTTAIIITYFDIIPVELLYGANSFDYFSIPLITSVCSRIALYIIGGSYIFVLLNTVSSKQSFFSKIGKNSFSIYILHTYLVVLLLVINYFIPWVFLKLIVSFIGAAGITYLLSRDIVFKYFNAFLNKLIHLILKKEY